MDGLRPPHRPLTTVRNEVLGAVLKTKGELHRAGLEQIHAARVVGELQVQFDAAVVVAGDDGVERKLEEAVAALGIPGDVEVVVRGIPLEQTGVTENFPTLVQRVAGKILRGRDPARRNCGHPVNFRFAAQHLHAHETHGGQRDRLAVRVLRPSKVVARTGHIADDGMSELRKRTGDDEHAGQSQHR